MRRYKMTIKFIAVSASAGAALGGLAGYLGTWTGAQVTSWTAINPLMDPLVKKNGCDWDYGDIYSISCPKNATATTADLLKEAYKLKDGCMESLFDEYALPVIGVTAS